MHTISNFMLCLVTDVQPFFLVGSLQHDVNNKKDLYLMSNVVHYNTGISGVISLKHRYLSVKKQAFLLQTLKKWACFWTSGKHMAKYLDIHIVTIVTLSEEATCVAHTSMPNAGRPKTESPLLRGILKSTTYLRGM